MKSEISAGIFSRCILLYTIFFLISSQAFAQFTTNTSLEIPSKVSNNSPVLSEEEQQAILNFAGDTSSQKLESTTPSSNSEMPVPQGNEADKSDKESGGFVSPLGSDALNNAAEKENSAIGGSIDSGKSQRVISASRSTADGSVSDNSGQSQGNETNVSFFRSLMALMAVLFVIVIAAWLMRKLFPNQVSLSMGNVVEVLGRSQVDGKHNLTLVKFGDDLLLLGMTAENMSVVDKVTDPDKIATITGAIEAERVSSISKSFAGVFGKARGDFELGDDLEDEQIIEEYDEDSSSSEVNDELSGLLDKVKGLNKLKHKR